MIELKHPEHAIEVARRLDRDGIDFSLTMVGDGKMKEEIQSLIMESNLEDKVHLVGAVKQSEVRGYMEENEIFLFTSDHNEGWGAVLNEAMNSFCATVANARIGSVPFLIKHGKNGLVYDENDIESLYLNTKFLLNNLKQCREISKNAYDTISCMWNAKQAVDNFFKVLEEIKGKKDNIKEGPCSKATIINDNWFSESFLHTLNKPRD